MPELSPRSKIIRDSMIYTPLFLLSAGLLLLMIVGILDRAPVGMFLLAAMAFLFGYQSIQSLRDLSERPREVTGEITRRWTKRDAFVSKSYYITVERGIYRIPVQIYLDLLAKDVVHIIAYPHTGTVISVERVLRPEPDEQPAVAESKGRLRALRTARLTSGTRRRDATQPQTLEDGSTDESAPSPGAIDRP